MKKIISLVSVAVATFMMVSCNCSQTSAPSAIDTIMSRYSVRSYTGEIVPQEQILELIKAGMAAPSGMNQQPWSFVVVTDKDMMDAMTPWGADTWKAAGTVIVVCGKTTMGEENNPNPLWMLDCSAAAENILLAAKAMGLGAVWNAAYPFDEVCDKCAAALGLPENVNPFAVIPVGYEQGSEEPKDKFDSAKIHFEKW